MWIYKDKRTFPSVLRPYLGETPEYRRGWQAALATLSDAVKPDTQLSDTLNASVRTLLTHGAAPEVRSPNQEPSHA